MKTFKKKLESRSAKETIKISIKNLITMIAFSALVSLSVSWIFSINITNNKLDLIGNILKSTITDAFNNISVSHISDNTFNIASPFSIGTELVLGQETENKSGIPAFQIDSRGIVNKDDHENPQLRVAAGVPLKDDTGETIGSMGSSNEADAIIEIFASDYHTGGNRIKMMGYAWDTTDISKLQDTTYHLTYVNAPTALGQHYLYVYVVDTNDNITQKIYNFNFTKSIWEGSLKNYQYLKDLEKPHINITNYSSQDEKKSIIIEVEKASHFNYAINDKISDTIYGTKCEVKVHEGKYLVCVEAVNGIKYTNLLKTITIT